MTLDQLADELRDYYDKFPQKRKSMAPIAFGYDYAFSIGRNASLLARVVFGTNSGYGTEIRKGIKLRQLHEERMLGTMSY
ncbi:MAG: hypothetical protein B6D63_07255 [Candidatus Latescibacteria bacterium 4484_7]|nr:MAG: hypothetical protein B6D63_07255 [Candidatus Latescibacteria bacterium 4484_7]